MRTVLVEQLLASVRQGGQLPQTLDPAAKQAWTSTDEHPAKGPPWRTIVAKETRELTREEWEQLARRLRDRKHTSV